MWKHGFLFTALICTGGAGDVERVTTETPGYCSLLAGILDRSPVSEDARALKEDGVRRCARGDTHDGITQLRRALLMSRGESPRS